MLFGSVSFVHYLSYLCRPVWDLGSRYNAEGGLRLRSAFGCFGCSGSPAPLQLILLYRPKRGGGGPNTQKFIFHCKTYGKDAQGHPKHPNTQNTQNTQTPKTPKHPKHTKHTKHSRHPKDPHHHPTTTKTQSTIDTSRGHYRQELI